MMPRWFWDEVCVHIIAGDFIHLLIVQVKGSWPVRSWEAYLRAPAQHKNRMCVRPEVSRTALTTSDGLTDAAYYTTHLKAVMLNTAPAPFTSLDLSYLRRVRALPCVHTDECVVVSGLTRL